MLIIILLVFFFASCELFCKRDRKFELAAGEQGICIMQLQLIFHSVTPSSINMGYLHFKFFYLDVFPNYFSPDVSQQLHLSVVYLTTKSVNYHYNYCHKYI